MDSGYINIARQSGLLRELSVIANNIANSSTVGYKRDAAVFTEYIQGIRDTRIDDALDSSVSIGRLGAHVSDFSNGAIRETGSALDLAIQGEGFFVIETPQGEQLTRAGNFITNEEGLLVTPDGFPVLDDAGGQIQIPPDVDRIVFSADGTLSANGLESGRIGVVIAPEIDLVRAGSNNWIAQNGFEPLLTGGVLQGYLEDSNVSPMEEIARMIQVQRYYDAGLQLMNMEDERINSVLQSIRRLA